jgi:hypothetical protein
MPWDIWDYGYLGFSILIVLALIGIDMASPADLSKVIENMKRAKASLDRAVSDAAKHATTLDSFDARLDLNNETMNKLDEYEKMMASMDLGSNGGPALDATFPSSVEGSSDLTSHSTKGVGKIGT